MKIKNIQSVITTALMALILSVSVTAKAEIRENVFVIAAGKVADVVSVAAFGPPLLLQKALSTLGAYRALGLVDYANSCVYQPWSHGLIPDYYCFGSNGRDYRTDEGNIVFSKIVHAGIFIASARYSLAIQYILASKLCGKLRPAANPA